METKLQEFQKSFDDSIAVIKAHAEPGLYEPHMDGLVRWMLTTKANPYGYIPSAANSFSSADSFAGLLHMIHHALYDDGDITFVSVDGEPRIVFVWRHEDNLRDFVLTDQEKDFEANPLLGVPKVYDVQVLDITPEEFGPLYDAHEEERKQRWEDLWESTKERRARFRERRNAIVQI